MSDEIRWIVARRPRTIPRAVARRVVERDGEICRYCGRGGSTFDHVIPFSRGGTSTSDNLVISCDGCNLIKRDSLPSECGMLLLSRDQTRRIQELLESFVAEWVEKLQMPSRTNREEGAHEILKAAESPASIDPPADPSDPAEGVDGRPEPSQPNRTRPDGS